MKNTKRVLFIISALVILFTSCDFSTIIKKDTGEIYNPDTGATYDSKTGRKLPEGFIVDPVTGKIYNPDTGEVYNPETGEVTNPDTGERTSSYDPKTGRKLPEGFIVDPVTGKIYNPETGEVYDPINGQITDPNTGEITSLYDPETGLVQTTNPDGEKQYKDHGGVQYNSDGTLKKELYYFLSVQIPIGAGKLTVENDGLNRQLIDYEKSKVYPILKNTQATLDFTENRGYKFTNWKGLENDVDSTLNPLVIDMTDNLFLQLDGIGDVKKVFITVEDGDSVDVLLYGKSIQSETPFDRRQSYSVMKGIKLELKATTQKVFNSFVIDGQIVKKNPYFLTVNTDLGISFSTEDAIGDKAKLEIEYPLNSADIVVTSEGENIKPKEKTIGKSTFYVNKDSYITIVGTPKDNYTYLEWRGDINSVENPLVTTIKEDTKLVFFTESDTKKISVDYANAKIKLTVNGVTILEKFEKGITYYEVNKSDLVRFEVFPNQDYVFKSWRGDLERTQNPIIERINNNISLILEVDKYYWELGLTYTNMNTKVKAGGVVLTPYKKNGDKRFYKVPKGVYTQIFTEPFYGYVWGSWSGDSTSSITPYSLNIDKNMNLLGNLEKDKIINQFGSKLNSMSIKGNYYGMREQTLSTSASSDDFAKAIRAKINKGAKDSDKPSLTEIKNTPSTTKAPPVTLRLSQYISFFVITDTKFLKGADIAKSILSDSIVSGSSSKGPYTDSKDSIIEGNGAFLNLSQKLNWDIYKKTEPKTKVNRETFRWVRDQTLDTKQTSSSSNQTFSEDEYANYIGSWKTYFESKRRFKSFLLKWIDLNVFRKESDTGTFQYDISYTKNATYTPQKFIIKEILVGFDSKAIEIVKVTPEKDRGITFANLGDKLKFFIANDPKFYFIPAKLYKIATVEIKSKSTNNREKVVVWLN